MCLLMNMHPITLSHKQRYTLRSSVVWGHVEIEIANQMTGLWNKSLLVVVL